VDLNWKLAGVNPQNWSKAKKCFHTITAGTVVFTCTFASSIITTANTIVDGTGESIAVIPVLPLALFAAGLAFGPTLNSLCSELIGRKLVSIISMATFALVTLGSAFVAPFHPFIACRFAAAILASPALDASLMMLFDLWSASWRQIPLAIYSLILLLGATGGAVAGPFMLYFKDRSWTSYVTLFVFIPCIALLVCTRETHRNTIRRRTSSGAFCGKLTKGKMKALGKPFHLLFARPRILMCTLLASCNFATFYAILSVFPQILAETFGRTLKSQGTSFLGMVVGVAVGFVLLVVIHFSMECMTSTGLRRKGPVQSEKDKTVSSHVHMDSRTSITPFRHTSSAMSRLGQSRNASRSSLPQLKTGPDAQIRDLNKNTDIAVAVTNYLKELPANAGKRVASERILHILEQSLAFCDVCLLLEGYDLTFDRATLAEVLAATLPTGLTDVAFMKMPAVPPPVASSPLASPSSEDQVWPFSPDSPQVVAPSRASRITRKETRARQRERSSTQRQLCIILFGSLLSTGGLFMFGWIVSLKSSSIVPVVATGIFACGGILVFVSSTSYLFTISGSITNGEQALAAAAIFRWLFAAAFAIFAVPLIGAMDTAWGTSVLGFINVGGSLLALILLVVSKMSKDSPRRQSAL
jgi:MFS family permease